MVRKWLWFAEMSDIFDRIQILRENQDAVERFLAMYDLFRLMTRGTPNVAEATETIAVLREIESNDRDHTIRAWATYYRRRILGEIRPEPQPFLPKKWQLFIVE